MRNACVEEESSYQKPLGAPIGENHERSKRASSGQQATVNPISAAASQAEDADTLDHNPLVNDYQDIVLLDQPEGPTTLVCEGETLAGVSIRCDVSIHELCRWNRIRRDESLRQGQRIRLSGLTQSERDAIPKTNWIETGMHVGTGHRRSGGGKYKGSLGFGGLGGAGGAGAVPTGVVVAAAGGSGVGCVVS